jgi:hypothetical protein
MRKFLIVIALGLVAVGVFDLVSTISFTRKAVLTPATVVSLEERTGPPKPSQNVPLHVRFTLPNSTEQQATTHLPLLQEVRAGDTIYLLVNTENQQDVRLPLISELWARPLAYLGCGLVLLVALVVLKGGIRRDWGASQGTSNA